MAEDFDEMIATARARRAKAESERIPATTRFARGANVAISHAAGAPIDINNLINRAIGLPQARGGSEDIQSLMSGVGMAPEPGAPTEGRAGAAGEFTGTALLSLVPIVGAGNKVSAAVQAGTPGIFRMIAREVSTSAATAPKTFLSIELASSVIAGIGGFEAAERFPDAQGAKAMGEIIGGMSPAGALFIASKAPSATVAVGGLLIGEPTTSLLTAASIRFARSFTMQGGRRRARARLGRAIDTDAIAERLAQADTELLNEAPLTVAQKIGDENLLALERAVMGQTEELSSEHRATLAELNRSIIESMVSPSETVPVSQVKAYFETLLDARLTQAIQKADERVLALRAGASREDLNRFAREELISARNDARAQEKELFDMIPEQIRAPTMSVQERYQSLLFSTPKAQRDDIPEIATALLNPKTKKTFLGNETSIKELRGLQSKLREEARIARSQGRFNRGRISDEIADSITEDIALADSGEANASEAVAAAVEFSKAMNQRFTQGEVGNLLGRTRSGGLRVSEGLTLEQSVGRRGPRSAEATDALLTASRLAIGRSDEQMRGYISGFILDDFRRAAVSEGRIAPKSARRYLRENEAVLNRFPEVRQRINRAIASGEELIAVERSSSPRESVAAVFAQANIGTEINRIIQSPKPDESMASLVRVASQDPTGRALHGVKDAWMSRLWSRSELSTLDSNDRPFVSGRRMTRELEDPQVLESMGALFTPKEIEHINVIRETAVRLDMSRSSGEPSEGIVGDTPGMFSSMLGRILGAQLGRVVAGKTGGGTVQTPGIFASTVQRVMRAGIQDPARRLLSDAIQDSSGQKLKALLTPLDSPENVRFVRSQMNAWAVEVLAEQYAYEE